MRDFNIFYNNDGKLHQVALTDEEYKIIEYYISVVTDGKIKVLDEAFCEATDK